MAGDGSNKKNRTAWSQREPGRAAPSPFPDPILDDVLPGTPAGLLPRKAIEGGADVKISDWGNAPGDGEIEKVELQIARQGSSEYVPVEEKVIEFPTTFPQVITLPSSFLNDPEHEGSYKLRYKHTNWVETESFSNDVPLVIDKRAPNYPETPARASLDIGKGPVFDSTLAGKTDIVATLVEPKGSKEGVTVAWAWVKDSLPADPEHFVPDGAEPLTDDRTINVPVDLIKSKSDGQYAFGYTLISKAGYSSPVSLYDLIPVALGELPVAPLVMPQVPEAVDGSIDREDALAGVYVEFPRIPNGKPTDEIEITWGTQALEYRTPVGANPAKFSLPMPASHLKQAYGAATAAVDTPVFYTVYRGGVPFASEKQTVSVDFSTTGPVNPEWPDPINPTLKVPEVYGQSEVKNELVAADENNALRADIVLVDPLVAGDTYQLKWNDVDIGAPYVVAADGAADPSKPISIDLTDSWDVIKRQGNSAQLPVHYTLSNATRTNHQESDRAKVKIEFLTVDLPVAVAQQTIGAKKRLTCNSLKYEGDKVGFHYLIPASDYLKAGMTVELQWRAYNTYAAPVEIESAAKSQSYGPITAEEARDGFIWFVEPYEVHILPTYGGQADQEGKAVVTYTLQVNGKPATSPVSDNGVVLSAASGTCSLEPPAP